MTAKKKKSAEKKPSKAPAKKSKASRELEAIADHMTSPANAEAKAPAAKKVPGVCLVYAWFYNIPAKSLSHGD